MTPLGINARTVPGFAAAHCRCGENSGRRLDGGHLVGMHLAVLAADRDVFAGPEGVGAEAVAALVVLLGGLVVIEHPAGVLRPARLVHEHADLVRLPGPEAADAAMGAVLL